MIFLKLCLPVVFFFVFFVSSFVFFVNLLIVQSRGSQRTQRNSTKDTKKNRMGLCCAGKHHLTSKEKKCCPVFPSAFMP